MKKAPFNYRSLIEAYQKEENAVRAQEMEQYMRSQFPFLGINAPRRKKILSAYLSEYILPEKTQWKEVIQRLWEEEEREFQMAGMDLAYRCRKYFDREDHQFFSYLITHRSWWDTVDFIASNIVGYYFLKVKPDIMESVADRWNLSENIWLVRTSIIFQLKYKERVRFDLLSKFILRHHKSKEFFIQKAMGWALRQYSKFNPDEVIRFVARCDLPKLTVREAMKHINRMNA